MKKNLLVTLADKNYINQAKQLFSSVYFNAGWKEDYMLLSHGISEKQLMWFREKGILVKECKPLYVRKVGGLPATLTSKFYLFTPEFKKWSNIIYLDADIIVRASLKELTKIAGFHSPPDINNNDLYSQIVNSDIIKSRGLNKKSVKKLIDSLKKKHNLKEKVFCAGVMAFSTDIIKEDTFSKLNDILKKYKEISAYGDQLTFNLFFYKKWGRLSTTYNVFCMYYMYYFYGIKLEEADGIILHFGGKIIENKPWYEKNFFHKEWKYNFGMAELIDLKKIPSPRKKWAVQEIQEYDLYLKKRRILCFFKRIFLTTVIFPIFSIDRNIGKLGIFLKKHRPSLYVKLKKIKEKWKIRKFQ